VRLFGMQLTRQQAESAIGRLDQIGGILPFELVDGRARGVRALRFTTGSGLAFTSLIDRGLDFSHAEYCGVPLCWRSANGDIAPSYYDPDDDRWLRMFFGGLMTTCGLTNFGPAGRDRYGAFGLHGRINCLPAEHVGISQEWEGDECVLEVTGTIRQTRAFGEDLQLCRRISTRLGASSLRVEDTVTNKGFARTPHMILYHCHGGFPILSEEAELRVSHSSMWARDAEAENGIDDWSTVTAPQPGFAEQVFIHTPIACADGRAAVALVNRRLRAGMGLGISIHFDPEQLPALIQWRMLGEGTYVMGIEPANCPTIEGRVEAERNGTLPFLEPGESRRYELEFRVLDGREEIDQVVAHIDGANGKTWGNSDREETIR
jgi:hypothetical protein